MVNRILFICLFIPSFLMAMPWGKDADLVEKRRVAPVQREHSTGVQIAEKMISFHQNVISRADGPRSHFVPSSSQYTLDAIRKYGFFKGYVMGCDRLMRENNEKWVYENAMGPYCILKYDPVK